MNKGFCVVILAIFLSACAANDQQSGPIVKSKNDMPEDFSVQPIERVAPIYPPFAVDDNITGYVVVQYTISVSGRARNIKVIESEPSNVFDDAAKESVRQWKFDPILEDGKPIVLTDVTTKIFFRLDSNVSGGGSRRATDSSSISGSEDYSLKNVEAMIEDGHYIEAIEKLNKIIASGTGSPLAYSYRAFAYMNLNDCESAIADLNMSISLLPNNVSHYLSRGGCYLSMNRNKEALADLNTAISFSSKFPQMYNMRGLAYQNMEFLEDALSDFNHAIELNPQFVDAYNNRGSVLIQMEKYSLAMSDLNEAKRLNPNQTGIYINTATAFLKTGQYDKAIVESNIALSIDPVNSQAFNNRGNAYMQKKMKSEALRDFNESLQLNPKNDQALLNRGILYLTEFGDKMSACADWQQACEIGVCVNYEIAKQSGDCQ